MTSAERLVQNTATRTFPGFSPRTAFASEVPPADAKGFSVLKETYTFPEEDEEMDENADCEEQPNVVFNKPECTPNCEDENCFKDHETEVEQAIKYLRDRGSVEFASSGGPMDHPCGWWTTVDEEINYRTGENSRYTFTPRGFSVGELVEIWEATRG